MTQDDVKDYLLLPEHNCYVYKEHVKDDGIHYYIRNKLTRKISVIYPMKSGKPYTPHAVCLICDNLSVPVHNYAKSHEQLISQAKQEAHNYSLGAEKAPNPDDIKK